MDKQMRKAKLREISQGQPYMTGIRIKYMGDMKEFPAFKIPLDYLIYNKYNGRIGSLVKSFEKQYHELNAENEDDKREIEKFLWESKADRNKSTMESIAENGQKVYGIVTSDGIIIDGNRRAYLLSKLHNDPDRTSNPNFDQWKYFVAVILPEDADKHEVLRLETIFQMGEDEKLDYNPIEKYLKCSDLLKDGFEVDEIAKNMNEELSQIKIWLEVMKLMDEYLDYMEYAGIYTRLDKTEDLFSRLNEWIKRYEGLDSNMVTWHYSDIDVNELKFLCFSYIRARYDTREYRFIGQPAKKGSIFCKSEELWESFLNEHKKDLFAVKEPSVQDTISNSQGGELSKVLESRDTDWISTVEEKFKANLGRHKSRLEDLNQENMPLELANRAWNTLNSINRDYEPFYTDQDFFKVIKAVNSLTFEFMKEIKKGNK